MREIQVRLKRLTPLQREIADDPHRFVCAAIGRRWGKTYGCISTALTMMLEGKRVGWFSATYKLLAGEGGAWPTLLAMIPQELIARLSIQDHTLRLRTGGYIEMWAMDRDGGAKSRGREYDLSVVDEAGHVDDLLGQWDSVMRAHLATSRGRAIFISTPNGTNDFSKLYDRGFDPEYPDWASYTAESKDSPFFPPEEWEDLLQAVARGEISAATFAQEYRALFISAEGLVYGLDRDGVAFYDPARNIRPAPCEWSECKWRVIAIDPGGSRDPTGMIAIGVDHQDRHHIYAAERLHGGVPVDSIQGVSLNSWIADIDKQGPVDAVVIGETGGTAIETTLRRLGWRAFKANMERAAGFPHSRSMFKSGRLTIAPALQKIFEQEIYVYRFDEAKPGKGGDPWATIVDSREHHGELMDCKRYGLMAVLDNLPGAPINKTPHRGEGRRYRASDAGKRYTAAQR